MTLNPKKHNVQLHIIMNREIKSKYNYVLTTPINQSIVGVVCTYLHNRFHWGWSNGYSEYLNSEYTRRSKASSYNGTQAVTHVQNKYSNSLRLPYSRFFPVAQLIIRYSKFCCYTVFLFSFFSF